MTEAVRCDTDFGKQSPSLRLQPLTSDDAKAVFDLYRKVVALVPHGHLTGRRLQEFQAILAEGAESASVGAWHGNRLIAYSLCSRERARVYPGAPLIAMLQAQGEILWTGKGTVVDPEFEGQLLLSRLLRLRGEQLHAKGAPHTAGLIATSNIPSLAGTLRAGAWIVGLSHDAYCQNFVCYAGRLQRRFELCEQKELPVDDLATLGQDLLNGWVGVGMARAKNADGADAKRRLTIARLSSAADE